MLDSTNVGWFRVDIFLNVQCPDKNGNNGGTCLYSWYRRGESGYVKVVDNQNPTGWVAFPQPSSTITGPTTKAISGTPYGVTSALQAVLPFGIQPDSRCFFNGYVEIYGQGDLGGTKLETEQTAAPRLIDISATLIDGTLPIGVTSTEKVIAQL